MNVARPVLGIIQTFSIVTLGLGVNNNRICRRRCAEDPSDEGTLLVL